MKEKALYMRFAKFIYVEFGMMLKVLWGLFYHNLLPLESILVFLETISYIKRFPFIFTVDDCTPIH